MTSSPSRLTCDLDRQPSRPLGLVSLQLHHQGAQPAADPAVLAPAPSPTWTQACRSLLLDFKNHRPAQCPSCFPMAHGPSAKSSEPAAWPLRLMSPRRGSACRQAPFQPSVHRLALDLPRRSFHNRSHGCSTSSLRSKSFRQSLPTGHLTSITRHARSMFIQTEPTPNPDALKFIPGRPVMTNGTREFLVEDDTRSSPLARSLLVIQGVRSVFFGPDFISINKDSETNWATTKPEIYSLLMEFFSASDRPVVEEGSAKEGEPPGPIDTRVNEDDSEEVAMIKELLDTRVRPAIQEDGGDLEYKGFDEESGVVQLMLKGSCRGCDSSTVTLKSGIERMLMHYIPEVQCVEQVESEEEKIANDEFAKFEARLRQGGKTVGI